MNTVAKQPHIGKFQVNSVNLATALNSVPGLASAVMEERWLRASKAISALMASISRSISAGRPRPLSHARLLLAEYCRPLDSSHRGLSGDARTERQKGATQAALATASHVQSRK